MPAGALIFLLGACTAGPNWQEQLQATGWEEEPVIVGAESTLGSPVPERCAELITALSGGQEDPRAQVWGYRHELGSYLLLKQWPDNGEDDLSDRLDTAAGVCEEFTLDYDGAPTSWTVRRVTPTNAHQPLIITATEDSGEPLVNMAVAGGSDEGHHWVSRVITAGSEIGPAELAALQVILER